MCKHELEGVDYEKCECCGGKYPCGHGYEVWQSQDRIVYFYWCQECKDFLAYKCHICGELFDDTTGHVLTPADEEDGSQYYICYECHNKEHSKQRDFKRLLRFVNEIDLTDHDKTAARDQLWEYSPIFLQLLSLWTAYCLNHNFLPDTLQYDQRMMTLYGKLHIKYPTIFVWRPEDMNEDEKSYFDLFDLYMGQLLA